MNEEYLAEMRLSARETYINLDVVLVINLAGERRINSELWHACAGPLVSLPPVGSQVVYFPQGHTEQVCCYVNLASCRFRYLIAFLVGFDFINCLSVVVISSYSYCKLESILFRKP